MTVCHCHVALAESAIVEITAVLLLGSVWILLNSIMHVSRAAEMFTGVATVKGMGLV